MFIKRKEGIIELHKGKSEVYHKVKNTFFLVRDIQIKMFPEKLASAYLTYLQWLSKVILTTEDHFVTCQKIYLGHCR